jgi:hypothetical protein
MQSVNTAHWILECILGVKHYKLLQFLSELGSYGLGRFQQQLNWIWSEIFVIGACAHQREITIYLN